MSVAITYLETKLLEGFSSFKDEVINLKIWQQETCKKKIQN